jgi:serine/threonine protein kinase
MECLTENTLADYLQLRLSVSDVHRMFAHIDQCTDCARLLTAAAHSFNSSAAAPLSTSSMSDAGAREPIHNRGSQIGRYVVERVLGFGGMGVVYATRDAQLNRVVAIKLLRPGLSGDAQTLQQLILREAQAMARLQHPNVITIYEVGTFDERLFIAMELIDGGTLRAWLRERRPGWREIVRMFCAAGEGLQAAHEAGLIHRDFKPDNVLVAKSGRICVTDFGLARLIGDESAPPLSPATPLDATRSNAVVGTPRYMAPEQLNGGAVDRRTDVFNFCAALFEALFGAPPFPAESLADVRQQHARGVVALPRAHSRVPARLRNVILRGLHIDATARPKSMTAVLEQLEPVARPRSFRLLAAVAIAIVALAIALLRGAGHTAPEWRAELMDHQPVFDENADTPIFSPDGKWLVYTSDRDGAWRFYREPSSGGPATALSPPGWGVWVPKWSRDGRYLYFEDNMRLFRMPADGGERELLAETVSYVAVCGDRLALVRPNAADCINCQRIVLRQGSDERELARVHGSLGRMACDEAGQQLVYSVIHDIHSGLARGDLWLVALDGGAPRQLTFDGANAHPTFHPDGRSIIFSSDRNGRLNLWELPLAGGTAEQLTFDVGRDLSPSVSPDGRVLIFDIDMGSSPLFAYPARGERHRLTRTLEDVETVVPTRDGRELIVGVIQGGAQRIVSYPLPGGDERIITEGQAPALTPDEKAIVFARSDGASTQILVLPRAGGPERRIATLPDQVHALSVAADGMIEISLGRTRGELGVSKVPLTGGVPTRELDPPWDLVLANGEKQLGIRLDMSGQQVFVRRHGEPWSAAQRLPIKHRDAVAWYPDGRAILYWTGAEVRRYELAGGVDTKLFDAPLINTLGLGASADGNTVYAVDPYSHVRRALIANYGQHSRPRH